MIETYRPHEEIVLVRNPHFREWSNAAQPQGFPDRIVVRLGVEPNRQATLVAQNRADVMLDVPPPQRLDEITTRYPARAHDYVQPFGYYLFLNTKIPPFDSPIARRAINLAIDRAAVARLWGDERLAAPTCQILPPNFPGYSPYCPYTARPDPTGAWKGPALGKAKALVSTSGTRGARVTVRSYEDPRAGPGERPFFRTVARAAASTLSRLGYRTDIEISRNAEHYFRTVGLADTGAQIGLWGWVADYPAASSFFSQLLSCDSLRPRAPFNQNPSQFCDHSVDRIMDRARRLQLTEPAIATRLWQKVDRMIVDQSVWAPLINPSGIDFVSERVGNYQRNPQFGILLSQLWVE